MSRNSFRYNNFHRKHRRLGCSTALSHKASFDLSSDSRTASPRAFRWSSASTLLASTTVVEIFKLAEPITTRKNMACCGSPTGPGYASPKDAMKGPRERIFYVPCIVPAKNRPDYISVVDVDPNSKTYCKVISRTPVPHLGDEMHHVNWNTCSSCYNDPSRKRDKLIVPCMLSDRIYTFDVSNALKPKLIATVEPEEMHARNISSPHTPHCLPDGRIMISTMGDRDREAQGSFVVLSGETFKLEEAPRPGHVMEGVWGNQRVGWGYDFWYQPRKDVLCSTEWGAPKIFEKGFNLADVQNGEYGRHIHLWQWSTGKHLQSIDLGPDGYMPLEVRFLHNPDTAEGFVCCAISSTLWHFYKSNNIWNAEKVIHLPMIAVRNWVLEDMPPMTTDIVISLDDRFLYVACYLTGEVRQYNIENTSFPRLTGMCAVGGQFVGDVTRTDGQPNPVYPTIRGKKVRGGPQMMQLSLDGKRLYMTTSLFAAWDRQFYPDMIQNGGMIVMLDVDTKKGGLKINKDFLVDYGDEPGGPVLAHEIRYPGGDCTSDIFA